MISDTQSLYCHAYAFAQSKCTAIMVIGYACHTSMQSLNTRQYFVPLKLSYFRLLSNKSKSVVENMNTAHESEDMDDQEVASIVVSCVCYIAMLIYWMYICTGPLAYLAGNI